VDNEVCLVCHIARSAGYIGICLNCLEMYQHPETVTSVLTLRVMLDVAYSKGLGWYDKPHELAARILTLTNSVALLEDPMEAWLEPRE
jgi:hypothetical protein